MAPQPRSRDRRYDRDRRSRDDRARRERRSHHRTDSTADLLPRSSERDVNPNRASNNTREHSPIQIESSNSATASNTLSAASLAKLNEINEKLGWADSEPIEYHKIQPREKPQRQPSPPRHSPDPGYKAQSRSRTPPRRRPSPPLNSFRGQAPPSSWFQREHYPNEIKSQAVPDRSERKRFEHGVPKQPSHGARSPQTSRSEMRQVQNQSSPSRPISSQSSQYDRERYVDEYFSEHHSRRDRRDARATQHARDIKPAARAGQSELYEAGSDKMQSFDNLQELRRQEETKYRHARRGSETEFREGERDQRHRRRHGRDRESVPRRHAVGYDRRHVRHESAPPIPEDLIQRLGDQNFLRQEGFPAQPADVKSKYHSRGPRVSNEPIYSDPESDQKYFRGKRRVVSGPYLEEGSQEKYLRPNLAKGGVASEVTDSDLGGIDGLLAWWKRKKQRAQAITQSEKIDPRPPRHNERRGEAPRPPTRKWWKRKRFWVTGIVVALILLIIIIAAAVSASKKDRSFGDPADPQASKPPNTNLHGVSPDSIPNSAKGTYMDPFTWYDTTDFNVTYTNVTVGGLPIMGLNSTWNNNVRANSNVPPLTEGWKYGGIPIRGMNIGGWLSIEPFITPSLFDSFSLDQGIRDEWTLCKNLGPKEAASTMEEHYSQFISEADFAAIQTAGFDHVRISFSYWAVTTYDGDPYVPHTSWRYLLRGIEWARKHGLRVNLDLHGIPGSQNGWNHSGHQGVIGWLNGTDGTLNGQRSLDIHRQLSAFFAQPRYENLVTIYGLVNEPRMVVMNTDDVLAWTRQATDIVRASGMPNSTIIVIGDGFEGLPNWQGKLTGLDNMLLDAHQYVIFNNNQISLNHTAKIEFACQGWSQQVAQSMSPATGFGSFLCGEWSQADTDCQAYVNNVGVGSRWTGTLNTGNYTTEVLIPLCPTKNKQCSCAQATSDPSGYSDVYKQFLLTFAEAQMHSFETGWGWFYWTWKTENATQWSWQLGMKAGILPTNARERTFDCGAGIPDFSSLGLPDYY